MAGLDAGGIVGATGRSPIRERKKRQVAHIFKDLRDEDLEVINHQIRRDSKNDLDIAQEVERLLGKSIGPTAGAKTQCVKRWRDGAEFRQWAHRWYMGNIEMERHLNEVRAKYEIISNVVKDDHSDGLDGVSKVLLMRLMNQAVEANDEELKAASGAKGWIAQTIRLALGAQENRWKKKAEELKTELRRMIEAPARPDGKTDAAALVTRVDEIMGLK